MTAAPSRDSSSGFCSAAVAEPSSRSLSTLLVRVRVRVRVRVN